MKRYQKLTSLEPDWKIDDRTFYAGTQVFTVELESLVRSRENPLNHYIFAVKTLDPFIERIKEVGDYHKIGDPLNHPSWCEGKTVSASIERPIPPELARNFLPKGFPLFVRNLPKGTTTSDLEKMVTNANSPRFKDACVFGKPKEEGYEKFRGVLIFETEDECNMAWEALQESYMGRKQEGQIMW